MKTKVLLVLIFSKKLDLLTMSIFWGRYQQHLRNAIKRFTPLHSEWILGLFLFTAALPVFAQQVSIWNKTVAPAMFAEADMNAVELGVQFRSTVSGHITSILFYRGAGNVGTHFGSIWASNGTLLATVEFTNETVEDGWQQANFEPSVPISARQIYTASYFAPSGNYAVEESFFANTGIANGPLELLQDGVNGGNGVYVYNAVSDFPSESYEASNYWIDVFFSETGTNTLGALSCNAGQVAKFDGNQWMCADEAQGPVGVDGAKGDTGSAGIDGAPGQQGPVGVAGATGPQGIQGPAGTDGVDTDPAQINTLQAQIDTLKAQVEALTASYAIGDTGPAGGIVFFVSNNGLNGLEAAPWDLFPNEYEGWGCFEVGISGANGFAVGTGAQNTADILAGCNQAAIAAAIADNYTLNGFNDWYLPSSDELFSLYQQHMIVGNFRNNGYWSSTQSGSDNAWSQHFFNGNRYISRKDSSTFLVRAIRDF